MLFDTVTKFPPYFKAMKAYTAKITASTSTETLKLLKLFSLTIEIAFNTQYRMVPIATPNTKSWKNTIPTKVAMKDTNS